MGNGIDKEQRLEAALNLRLGIINKTIHTTERAMEGIEVVHWVNNKNIHVCEAMFLAQGIPELSNEVLDNVDVVQQCDVKKLTGSELEQVGQVIYITCFLCGSVLADQIPLFFFIFV